MKAKFVHTNLIARDWRSLVAFYQSVFGCIPVPPERDLSGRWLDSATNLKGAHIRGIHLRLPGYEEGGPTLEIFEYAPAGQGIPTRINTPGFSHIAFQVDDVLRARAQVLAAGGREYGERASVDIPGAGTVAFVYVADPEGNVIELQSWSKR